MASIFQTLSSAFDFNVKSEMFRKAADSYDKLITQIEFERVVPTSRELDERVAPTSRELDERVVPTSRELDGRVASSDLLNETHFLNKMETKILEIKEECKYLPPELTTKLKKKKKYQNYEILI
jgi:hypothetical protein